MTPALILALLLGAGLLGLALRTEEQRRAAPVLPPPDPDHPDCTVLLPVRDEAANVLPCVETLLAQTARPRVRVIDDGSTDGTGRLVAEKASGEPRLELVTADPLPPGWRGKLHALHCGWRRLETPWVLLTDADTRHGPELLARSLAAARQQGLDAISLAGTQEARGPGEALLTPAVFALLDILLGDWRPAGSGSGPAVANGQFLLLRREAWEACGGFEPIRSEPIDDVAIVARLRRHGLRTAFFRAPELRVRMYRGFGETWRGWRRNLGGLFGPHPARMIGILGALLLPAVALVGFLASGRAVEATLLWSAGVAAAAVLRTERRAWSLLYPADALLLAAALALGALDRRRGRLASWKGREMPV
ncbi:MAG TPA: glycosyltransferase [Thermoanaerobaculia bacterium]|nr:glycosyltransferase [Thermoanaerobaculia bacterium]